MISLINLFFPRLWSRREVVMKFTQIYITPEKSVQKCQEYPIGSMYGIYMLTSTLIYPDLYNII